MCNSSDIIEVININEGECASYIQTEAEIPASVGPPYGGLVLPVFAYAQFGIIYIFNITIYLIFPQIYI